MSSISKSLNQVKYFIKNTANNKGMKNKKSKIKPRKTGKELGATYRLGCKDYIHNFKPQEVRMTSKVLREKLNCVACRSSESRFLKQKHNNKKKFSQIKKTCIFIVKNVKNTKVKHFEKKICLDF